MKNTITLFSFLFIITSQIFSQKIAENKVDEFTGDKITKTSLEKLVYNLNATAYFRIIKINDKKYFNLKLYYGSGSRTVFAIEKDQEIMFKLKNGKILTLKNIEYTITCTGCASKGIDGSGVEGISVLYSLDEDVKEKLIENEIEKIRVYTTKNYLEYKIKPKRAKKIPIALKLIN